MSRVDAVWMRMSLHAYGRISLLAVSNPPTKALPAAPDSEFKNWALFPFMIDSDCLCIHDVIKLSFAEFVYHWRLVISNMQVADSVPELFYTGYLWSRWCPFLVRMPSSWSRHPKATMASIWLWASMRFLHNPPKSDKNYTMASHPAENTQERPPW